MPEFEEILSDTAEERNLLAVVYQSYDAWLRISDRIGSEDFAHPVNKALWAVMDDMRTNGVEPASINVYERLPDMARQLVDDMGSFSYVEKFGEIPVKTINAEHHADKLKAFTLLRRGRKAGEDLVELALEAPSSKEFMDKAELIVNEIPGPIGDEVVLLGSIAREFVNTRRASPADIPGLKTGYEKLDTALQGLQSGRMYVVGARKKTGKSVLLLNMVKHIAVEDRIPVLYISTEQTQEDEVSRLLSMVSQVEEFVIDNGTVVKQKEENDQLEYAISMIEDAPIHFAHDPFFTLGKLRRTVKKHRLLNKVECVFFDYIKIPPEDMGSRDKWARVGELAYGLKAIASEFEIPVVTAVQINRDGAKQFAFEGDIDSDAFANSDMIAQAMSVGMVLRPLNKDEMKDLGQLVLNDPDSRILKITDNRHGEAAYAGLFAFDGKKVTLKERTRV